MAAQGVYAWPQQRPKGSKERPGGDNYVSHVPPGRDDVHELASGPELIAGPLAEPVIAVDAMGGDHAPDEIVAGALALQGRRRVQQATPPVPEQAAESVNEDVEFAKARAQAARR